MRARHGWVIAAIAVCLLAPGVALAQHLGKVTEARVDEEGAVEVWASVVDQFGLAPELGDFDRIELSFGEANTFSGDEAGVTTFRDAGRPTDYVIIIPAYEGFGIDNTLASAEGAGWFQNNYFNAEAGDTALVLLYGDGVLLHEGNAGELAEALRDPEAIMRVARPYMLFALEEAIRHLDALTSVNRRVIVLVGTGLDVQLSDASNVQMSELATDVDFERAQRQVLQQHQSILRRYIEEVESVQARIYAIGLNETRPDYLEVLRVLSRKTGGTFRRVRNIGELAGVGGDGSTGVFKYLGSELSNELILAPTFTAEAGKEYEVWATFRMADPTGNNRILPDFSTRRFYLETPPRESRLNVIPYLIAVGIILFVVFLLLMVLYLMSAKLKKKRAHQAEVQRLKEVIALAAFHCPTCFRTVDPAWEQCLFCAQGMGPLEEKPQVMTNAEEARTKLDELEGRAEPEIPVVEGTAAAAALLAAQQGKRQCPTCFRVVENEWQTCMFCEMGMAPLPVEAPVAAPSGEVAKPIAMYQGGALAQPPQQAAAPGGGGAAGGGAAGGNPDAFKEVRLEPGMGVCPNCNRPVPGDWSECLYCKAGV